MTYWERQVRATKLKTKMARQKETGRLRQSELNALQVRGRPGEEAPLGFTRFHTMSSDMAG